MIGTAKSIIKALIDQPESKTYEIKEYKKKRSLNANNYAWVLITEIGNATKQSNQDVYMTMLKRYGQGSDDVSVRSDVDVSHYFKDYEVLRKGKVNGVEYTGYMIYKGSSTFNSAEMSRFIEGIVNEAEDLGIPTLDEEKIGIMTKRWKGKHE